MPAMTLHSIKAKILWSVLLIVATLSIASTSISIYQQIRSMDRDLKRIGINAVRNLADNAELGIFSQNSIFLRPALEALASDRSFAYAVVYNQNNEVLDIELSAGITRKELMTIPEDILKELNRVNTPIWRNIPMSDGDIYEFFLPVIGSDTKPGNDTESLYLEDAVRPDSSARQTSGKRVGYVRYGQDMKDYNTTLRQTVIENLLISSFIFLASVIFILTLTSRITNPIAQLARISEAVSGGDLEQRINVFSKDEVGKLALSFNRMIEAVKQRDAKLRIAQVELEQRVEERTRELTLLNKSLNEEISERMKVEKHLENTASTLALKAEDLERSNKELDQFAYIAAHDLKAPLRAIANLSAWIEDDLQGKLTAANAEHMLLLRGRVHRLENLIEGILHYSRLGKHDKQTIENVDVREVVNNTVEMLSPPAGFSIVMTTEMPEFPCVRLLLAQVFGNLIGNAIKYHHRDQGRIEVSAHEAGNFYEFVVADDGPGIEKQYHEKIFVIFQTLNARDNVESTGIGLAIVKKIVEDQGGKIKVESEIGQGARFIFTWPKQLQTARQTDAPTDRRMNTGDRRQAR